MPVQKAMAGVEYLHVHPVEAAAILTGNIFMKRILSLASLLFIVSGSAWAADANVKLSNVHLCCNSCVKGVEKAVTSVAGATAQCDKDAGTVTITAPDAAGTQKAVEAFVAAGYFGSSSDTSIKVKAHSGVKKGKVQSLKVSGVHLCCTKCVTGLNEAVTKVAGVKGTTAAKGAETFEITGDFDGREAMTALNKAGFAGKVGK